MVTLFNIKTTYFSPLQFQMVPELTTESQRTQANGLISGTSSLCFILGAIIGSLFGDSINSMSQILYLTFTLTFISFILSMLLQSKPALTPHNKLSWQFWKDTYTVLKLSMTYRYNIFKVIIFVALLTSIEALLLKLTAVITYHLWHTSQIVQGITILCCGIGLTIGSIITYKILPKQFSILTQCITFSCIVLSLILMCFSLYLYQPIPNTHIYYILTNPWVITCLLSFFLFGVSGSLFTTPCFTYLQTFCKPNELALILSSYVLINAAAIILFSLLLSYLFYLKINLNQIFILIALVFIVGLILFPLTMRKHK